MMIADSCVLVILAQLLGNNWNRAWIYALHPLPIVETAGSGHLEPLAIAALLWGIKVWNSQRVGGAFWILIATGIKIMPMLFLPFMRKDYRGIICGVLVLVLCSASVLQKGVFEGIFIYAQHWSFNGSAFDVLNLFAPDKARFLVGLFLAGVVVYCLLKKQEIFQIGLWITGAFLILSPTVHPWYGLWVFPFAILCFADVWFILLSLLPISYVALLSYDPQTQSWSPPLWPQIVEYGIPLLVLVQRQMKRWRTGL